MGVHRCQKYAGNISQYYTLKKLSDTIFVEVNDRGSPYEDRRFRNSDDPNFSSINTERIKRVAGDCVISF